LEERETFFKDLVLDLSNEDLSGISKLRDLIFRINQVWHGSKILISLSNPQRGEISFDQNSQGYEWLSNFYPTAVLVNGKVYCSGEHAFQTISAEWFDRPASWEVKKMDYDAIGQKMMGDFLYQKWCKNFGSIEGREFLPRNIDLVRAVTESKFDLNPHFADALVATSSCFLKDRLSRPFWGVDKDGNPPDIFGMVLMETRARLINQRCSDLF
jgi:predicted NAD-dependent protein-ADP-ribosyltransferase YbiA (DUF1768 family)